MDQRRKGKKEKHEESQGKQNHRLGDRGQKHGAKQGNDDRQTSGQMLFSFKNKYHYTYPNTYIALYNSHAKVTCNTHTHTKQEVVNHPS